jgi:hypothetical protein
LVLIKISSSPPIPFSEGLFLLFAFRNQELLISRFETETKSHPEQEA